MQNRRLYTHEKNQNFYKRRFLVCVLFLIALLLYSLFQLESKIRPIASEIAAQQSRTIAVKSIQQACNNILKNQPVLYDELYHIQRAEDGRIQSIELDALHLNMLEDALVGTVNEALSQLENSPIEISLGTLSGMQILNGYGPKIGIQIMPMLLVTSQVSSRFCSAGINQTRLEIYIHFQAEIETILAGFTQSVPVETDIVVAQVLIVGEVPQMYAQSFQ